MLTPYPETREEVMRVEEENVLLLVQGRGAREQLVTDITPYSLF